MIIALGILGLFILYPIVMGFMGVEEFEFRLEIKSFSSPYYVFGLFFVEHSTEDPEYVEQELTIALYFFSLVFIFYKHKDEA